ncbi:hypothetical protein F0562_008068 [Nyssa sinensis]|uniref:Uncharacterized protein n=1 Tax=Nyssa sinensis TaxID=561372 RepID=A0A5J5A5Q6_9ASTE|nr:hypothetical protein F0562_008068 [Nyssa sinensis]
MASEMPDNSQSLVDIDEFEGLEVTEIDGALLRDLLEELEEEEAKNVTVESSEFYDGEGDETAYGFLWQDN